MESCKFDELDFYECVEHVKEKLRKWSHKEDKKKKRVDSLKTEEITILMPWSTPLLRLVCRKKSGAVSESWKVMNGQPRVELLFMQHNAGFNACGNMLKTNAPGIPITTLIADSNYGAGLASWDKVPWKKEFEESINFVLNHNNKDLSGVSFFWFVADRQLHDCLQACSNQGLNYKLLVWHKPGTLANVTGQRFRHNCEFIVCGWVGHERDFVQNIDREDQDRYNTVASIQKTKRFWRNEEGQVVNPYQKPVLLLRKLLVMAQRTTNGLVVDITCGTGTIAVGSLLLPFPG